MHSSLKPQRMCCGAPSVFVGHEDTQQFEATVHVLQCLKCLCEAEDAHQFEATVHVLRYLRCLCGAEDAHKFEAAHCSAWAVGRAVCPGALRLSLKGRRKSGKGAPLT